MLKFYTREGVELDARSKAIIEQETSLIRRDESIEIKAIQTSAIQKIAEMLKGAKTTDKLSFRRWYQQNYLPKGTAITDEVLAYNSF